MEKVKGHATQQDVGEDEDLIEKKRRNDEADSLAVQGAASHGADPVVRAMQKHEAARMKDIQKMMIDVGKARYKQITSWGTDGLEKQLLEAMGREKPGANEEDKMEDDSAFIDEDGEEEI